MADLREVWYREILPLLQEYFYEDRQRLIALLGRYDAEAQGGFVEEREAPRLLGGRGRAAEPLWRFHRYQTGELEQALRSTFVAEA
jgi:hypothetical protein